PALRSPPLRDRAGGRRGDGGLRLLSARAGEDPPGATGHEADRAASRPGRAGLFPPSTFPLEGARAAPVRGGRRARARASRRPARADAGRSLLLGHGTPQVLLSRPWPRDGA